MKQFTNTIEINASKDQVWDVLYNRFGDAAVYNPMVEASHSIETSGTGTGSERKCNFDANGKNAVCERITETRGDEAFDIEIYDGSLPMMDKMDASVKVEALGERTSTSFTISYTTKPAFMGGMMKGPMKKKMMSVLVGLKYHLETGELVTKENIKAIMKEYRSLSDAQGFAVDSSKPGVLGVA